MVASSVGSHRPASRSHRIPSTARTCGGASATHHATKTLDTVTWNNSTLIKGDLAEEVMKLKGQAGRELQVHGSGNLAQDGKYTEPGGNLPEQAVDELGPRRSSGYHCPTPAQDRPSRRNCQEQTSR